MTVIKDGNGTAPSVKILFTLHYSRLSNYITSKFFVKRDILYIEIVEKVQETN